MQPSHVIALFAQAPAYISGGSAHKVVIGKPLGYHPKEVDGSCERHKPGLKSAKKGLGSSCMYVTLPHITLSPCCLVCTPYHTCMPYMIIVVLARHIATTRRSPEEPGGRQTKGVCSQDIHPADPTRGIWQRDGPQELAANCRREDHGVLFAFVVAPHTSMMSFVQSYVYTYNDIHSFPVIPRCPRRHSRTCRESDSSSTWRGTTPHESL